MFTVKHRDNDGSEVVFEAKQVRMQRLPLPDARSAGDNVLACKIICDVSDGQITYDGREARSADDDNNILWVMNRDGATVATYYL